MSLALLIFFKSRQDGVVYERKTANVGSEIMCLGGKRAKKSVSNVVKTKFKSDNALNRDGLMQACTLLEQGNAFDAFPLFQKGLKSYSELRDKYRGDEEIRKSCDDIIFSIQSSLVLCYVKIGYINNAISLADALLSQLKSPNQGISSGSVVGFLENINGLFLELIRRQKCDEVIRMSENLFPDIVQHSRRQHALCLSVRSFAFVVKYDYVNAFSSVNAAIEVGNSFPDIMSAAYYQRGALKRIFGDFDGAIQDFKKSSELGNSMASKEIGVTEGKKRILDPGEILMRIENCLLWIESDLDDINFNLRQLRYDR